MFRQDNTCPALLFVTPSGHPFVYGAFTLCGRIFQNVPLRRPNFMVNWAVPGSLAATDGISIDFFSSGYLDVSVPRVRLRTLCVQVRMTCMYRPGFPIRTPPDQSLFASSPRTIAGYDVLHRLLPPGHPPSALVHLTI